MDWRIDKAAALVLRCLGALVLCTVACGPERPILEQLAGAAHDLRPIEARLTGFGHGECTPGEPGEGLIPEPVCSPIVRDAELVAVDQRLRAASDETISTRHARGLWHLLTARRHGTGSRESAVRDSAPLDAALAELQEASRQAPGDARLRSDLAAARLLRAQRFDDADELIQALATIDAAAAVDPDLPAVRFNRALILEHLFLARAAGEAWRAYLELDATSPWSAEAARRLAAVTARPAAAAGWKVERQELVAAVRARDPETVRRLVARWPQEARQEVERQALPGWAEVPGTTDGGTRAEVPGTTDGGWAEVPGTTDGGWAEVPGTTDGEARLGFARQVAAALWELHCDSLLLDTVSHLDAQRRAGKGDAGQLADAFRRFRDGLDHYYSPRSATAHRLLREASASFAQQGSPFRLLSDYYAAVTWYHRQDYRRSLAALAALETGGREDLILEAYVGWMEGLNHLSAGRVAAALAPYRRALEGFETAGEAANATAVRVLLAEAFESLGRRREAWALFYRALQESAELTDPKRRVALHTAVADALIRDGRTPVALYFQDEAVRHAAASGDAHLETDALLWRAHLRFLAGHSGAGHSGAGHSGAGHSGAGHGDAAQDLAAARAALAAVTDEDERRRLAADVALVVGVVTAASDPAAALPALGAAIEHYRSRDHQTLATLLALRTRAAAWGALGRPEAAAADLEAGIAIYERQVAGAPAGSRWGQVEDAQHLFEARIRHQLDEQRDAAAAFATAERARRRTGPGGRTPAGVEGMIEAVIEALPEGAVLVEYAVLDDRLVTWRLDRSGLELVQQTHDPQHLAWPDPAAEAPTALFDTLLRPWIDALPTETLLVLVPDAALHGVPFAALRDPRSGRRLVEDHPLLVAPSAAHFVAASEAARRGQRHPVPGDTLVLGSPAFDRRLLPWLRPLPEAAVEARTVGAIWGPGSRVLVGEAADRARFLALAPGARRLHLAAHAWIHPRRPAASLLALAPSPGGAARGIVTAADLAGLDLSGLELAVLSACSTAAGQAGEGTASFARIFLEAGTTTVVASLWEVDDRVTARFMESFHRRLAGGLDAARALRAVQLEFLRSGEPELRRPRHWAAFQVHGALDSNPSDER